MQKPQSKLKKIVRPGLIASLCAISLIGLATLVSLLYVSQTNQSLNKQNYWQEMSRREEQYSALKNIIASGGLPADKNRARELAQIYRSEGKAKEASEIYRLLWSQSASADPINPDFITDARELASIYSDMGAANSAVESYQKILKYDQEHDANNHKTMACDYNNLGQCYYTVASCTADTKLRKQYLTWARDQYLQSEKERNIIGPSGQNDPDRKTDLAIIRINKTLLEMDLNPSAGQMDQMRTAMNAFAH